MKRMILFSLIILCFCLTSTSYAQTDELSKMSERLKKIEQNAQAETDELQQVLETLKNHKQNMEDIDKKIGYLDQQIDSKVKQFDGYKNLIDDTFDRREELLQEKFQNEKDAFNNEKDAFNNRINTIETVMKILFALLAIGGISIVIYFFRSIKKTKEFSENKIKEEYNKFFDENYTKINTMIDEHSLENKLKLSKSILIFHNHKTKNENIDFLRQFFKGYNFNNFSIKSFSDTTIEKYNKNLISNQYQMVFFYNEDHKFNPLPEEGKRPQEGLNNEVLAYINKNIPEKVIVFYFGSGRINYENVQKNFASATFRTQLHGNIMNALRYQDLVVGGKTIS